MTKLFHAANIQVFRELVSIYITDCYTIITESSCLLGVSLLCEQTLFLFSYLEINFVADVRNQIPLRLFLLLHSFFHCIDRNAFRCAYPHSVSFRENSWDTLFLLIRKLIETSPFIDGLNRLVYALLSSKTMSFSS